MEPTVATSTNRGTAETDAAGPPLRKLPIAHERIAGMIGAMRDCLLLVPPPDMSIESGDEVVTCRSADV